MCELSPPRFSAGSDVAALSPARYDVFAAAAAVLVLAATLVAVYAVLVSPKPFVYDDEMSVLHEHVDPEKLWPLWGTAEGTGPFESGQGIAHGRPASRQPFVCAQLHMGWARSGRLPRRESRDPSPVRDLVDADRPPHPCPRSISLANSLDAAGPLSFAVSVLLWAVHPLKPSPWPISLMYHRTRATAFCYLGNALLRPPPIWCFPPQQRARLTCPGPFPHCSHRLAHACHLCDVAAGMASKEVMVSAPLVVLLFDWTFVSRSLCRILRYFWPLYAGLAATWLLLFAPLTSAVRVPSSAGFHLSVLPWIWWATQAKVFWMYLKLAVWPWPLVIHYELPYASNSTMVGRLAMGSCRPPWSSQVRWC